MGRDGARTVRRMGWYCVNRRRFNRNNFAILASLAEVRALLSAIRGIRTFRSSVFSLLGAKVPTENFRSRSPRTPIGPTSFRYYTNRISCLLIYWWNSKCVVTTDICSDPLGVTDIGLTVNCYALQQQSPTAVLVLKQWNLWPVSFPHSWRNVPKYQSIDTSTEQSIGSDLHRYTLRTVLFVKFNLFIIKLKKVFKTVQEITKFVKVRMSNFVSQIPHLMTIQCWQRPSWPISSILSMSRRPQSTLTT